MNASELFAKIFGRKDDFTAPTVNPYSALTLMAVWYAVNKIAGDIAQLPLAPYTSSGREVSQDTSSAAYALLRQEANAYQTAHAFKELLTLHALLWGDGRAYIRRDKLGQPVELIPLMPDRTETVLILGEKLHVTKPDRDDRLTLFEDIKKSDPKDTIVLEDKDVLHIMGLSENGVHGISVVTRARRAIGIGTAGDARSAKQMVKGFTGKLFIQTPAGVLRKDEDAKQFLAQFRKQHSASDDGETAGLLREGATANVVNMSNEDMQFLQSRAFQRQEIMLLFGLDSMPGDKDSVSYNSLAQKSLAYYQGTLSRWCDRWVQACNKSLLSETEKRQQTHFFKFITAATLRGTTKERYEVYQIGRQIGVLSSNDVRQMEDMNPRDGGDAYDNPSITPGDGTAATQPPPVDGGKAAKASNNAARLMLENLLDVEANRARDAVKSRNFLSWMDKFYPKWEAKLADSIESIGGDRELATVHCNESKRRLLECADNATVDTMAAVVAECVSSWKSRVNIILEEMELAHV